MPPLSSLQVALDGKEVLSMSGGHMAIKGQEPSLKLLKMVGFAVTTLRAAQIRPKYYFGQRGQTTTPTTQAPELRY